MPLLFVFAAFLLVNYDVSTSPCPGGMTGHAVGFGIAAAMLGLWESLLAISAALLIQALFFGDGGCHGIWLSNAERI